jgi:hypothetical protein
MMCPVINNPASCEICAVILFLHDRNVSAAEVHRELCVVYGPNVKIEGATRQWCRMPKDGQTNGHDEEKSGRLAICSE